MKTLIIPLICGCLFTANNVSAQQPKDKMLPVVTITATGTNVTQKVRKAFERSFKNSENLSWYQVSQNFLVKFIRDDQEHNALFSKNGALIYHVTYGYEKNIPAGMRYRVKLQYDNYQITRVFNIKQDNRNIWVVNLEDENYMILARIEDEEMNEVNRFKKNEYTEGALTKVNNKN